VLGLARDIPWDLGDSLLNAWILAWDADHLLRFAAGDFTALRGFWNANIFHPEPLTLAYSEHLVAQAVQILPVYALTGNIILSYNLLFLSTFVLSGLGMYLFVREITGSSRAAFAAGLIYAFAPYRLPQFAHLQVLSSQWMPFTLYFLRRYFDVHTTSRGIWCLVGAAAALVAQNLSNGYFLMFFSPMVAVYAFYEMTTRGLWAAPRVWAAMAATGAAVALLTVPFLLPYLELRRLGFPARSLTEVATYSADVLSYWTSPAESHVWGRAMRAFPKNEGDLFPTLSALVLALAGLAASVGSAWRISRRTPFAIRRANGIAYVLIGVCALYALLVMLVFTGIRFDNIGPLQISVRRIGRSSLVLAMAFAILAVVSPRVRLFARAWLATIMGFTVLAVALTFILSLGPDIRTQGRLIGQAAPYSLLYSHVPGFDGLRVPARYAMLVMLFLATGAGVGGAAIERRFRRGGALVVCLGVLAVIEAFAAPIVINGTVIEGGYAPPPPRVYTGSGVPAVYRFLKTLPSPGTVIAEFPFGETTFELRYMFYSTNHWHPLLNGYSGTFPLSYSRGGSLLRRPLAAPDLAWQSLRESGATHAVVHGSLYLNGEGQAISRWIVGRGGALVAEFDGDSVFALR